MITAETINNIFGSYDKNNTVELNKYSNTIVCVHPSSKPIWSELKNKEVTAPNINEEYIKLKGYEVDGVVIGAIGKCNKCQRVYYYNFK